MDPQKIQQAIDFAKQNPNSAYATELRRRIESGQLDKDLHNAGLSQYATAPQQKGFVRNVAEDVLGTLLVKPAARATEAVVRTVAPKSTLAKGYEAMADEGSQKILGMDIESQKGFGEGGGRQIAGETLKIGSFLFPYGRAAKAIGTAVGSRVAGNVVSGAAGGYLADVGYNLSDKEKTVSESLKPGVGTVIGAAIPLAGPAVRATGRAVRSIKPTPSVDETVGRILQGETKDVPLGRRALEAIDLTGVKTREQLSGKLKSVMDNQMKVVDAALSKDPRQLSLDEYAIRLKNDAGQEVKIDAISNAIDNLEEIYAKSGDELSRSNLNLIRQKAITEGLTHKEVNDLARLYSEEFGSKAFNKVGDPLTSVNAQMYENTRRYLKEAARGGLGFGEEAKMADRLYNALSNTNRLVERGVEAVNKLAQKTKEKNIIEKLSNKAVKMVNFLTGGALKEGVSAIIPSNIGNKVDNWLDLERTLQRDLKIIQKASDIVDDSALIKFLNDAAKRFKFPGDAFLETKSGKGVINYTKNPKMGLSVKDVSSKSLAKNIDATDINIMQAFTDAKLSGVGKLTPELKKQATELAQSMGIPETFLSDAKLAQKFTEILDARRAIQKAK